ncbi:peptide chain release factor N(5)-glutamine methyltransferase [Mycoplasmopsis mucosicanis]|uniref:peptide chain release factor N(5)-glutamine methyltransferase n=1 Tax=Mycoplasmopsis mucosicanis TaxID=458208 RepID=A0A507SRZ7_9BACT|nr:peptide chain release factor N(5)-glutamine methyltransferase [Mycoplasmopsis mucosicanis]TQC54031.1 peptide chain release factor N(5)-glutamine methyltransferase [Mycoplasmopsis mucosicanis]
MPTKEELLQEKKRYGLPLTISFEEEKKLDLGMPIQQIMGFVEFLNTRINLNHKVLIPRYETEELVDYVLKNFIKNDANFDILDLCCGSGFIGLSIKKNAPKVNVSLSDIDPEAISQTRENALINFNSLKDIEIYQSDLFSNILGKFDLIISNPPYLDENIILDNHSSLLFEPQHALYAGDGGLYFYKKILAEYKKFLKPGGKLIFEINPLHIEFWRQIPGASILKDINKKDRFVIV